MSNCNSTHLPKFALATMPPVMPDILTRKQLIP